MGPHCSTCVAKDQKIEHLERECRELNEARIIVKLLERDLKKIGKRYLGHKPIRLPFRSVLELLHVKAKKEGYEKGFKDGLNKIIKPNIEALIANALPHLKSKLQNAFPIPVLIKPNDEISLMKFRAIALRGGVKQVRGVTPDDAYQNLKDSIASFIACRPESLVHMNRGDLVDEFKAAKPLREDEIGGFRVEIRLSEGAA